MATPLTIQRFPRGLLDLLGSKSNGDNPTVLSPTVVPILDLSAMYQFDKMEARSATTNVVNLAGAWAVTGTQLTVPAGEIWLLHNLSVNANANLAAGEAYTLVPAIYRTQWSKWQLGPDFASGSGVGTRPSVGWQFERPEIMRPGDTVGVYVTSIASGASQFTLDGWICRLTI